MFKSLKDELFFKKRKSLELIFCDISLFLVIVILDERTYEYVCYENYYFLPYAELLEFGLPRRIKLISNHLNSGTHFNRVKYLYSK